jgi:26S proteasome regulatory subunit N6
LSHSTGTELSLDPTIRSHLAALYDTLLEQNLLRLIEPYGCVQLEHVAQGVGQSRATVEKKLSQMILDKVFYGVLDQGNGWLVVFDEPVVDVSPLDSLLLLFGQTDGGAVPCSFLLGCRHG